MRISQSDWIAYIERLAKIDKTAADKMRKWVEKNGLNDIPALIDYAYAVATRYGEASAALAAEMYDVTAAAEGVILPAAEVAETAPYGDVAKAVHGVTKQSSNVDLLANAVSRLVKRAGADTTLKNAERDGAQFAWIPMGDTCSFCLTLASRGWQYMSKKAMRNGHAEHIHANCDCTYAVRHDGKSDVAGYNPDKYLKMYYGAEGKTPQERINAMRRAKYAQNKEEINAQKRAAYAEQRKLQKINEKELLQRSYRNTVQTQALDAPGYIEKFGSITDNADVNKAIYENAVEILKHCNGTDHEDLYLINGKTGEVIHKFTTSNLPNRVDYDKRTRDAIAESRRKNIEIISIHNHPGGLPPTLDDGVSAFDNGYIKGIAIGHNLEVYEYGPAKRHYSQKQCEVVQEQITKTAMFSIDFEESVWYDILKKAGMEVKRK